MCLLSHVACSHLVGVAQSALLLEPVRCTDEDRDVSRRKTPELLRRKPVEKNAAGLKLATMSAKLQTFKKDCCTSAVEGLRPRDLVTIREGKVIAYLMQCDQHVTCPECWLPMEPLIRTAWSNVNHTRIDVTAESGCAITRLASPDAALLLDDLVHRRNIETHCTAHLVDAGENPKLMSVLSTMKSWKGVPIEPLKGRIQCHDQHGSWPSDFLVTIT